MKQLRKLLPLMLVLVLMLGLAVAASAEENESEHYGFRLNGRWYNYDTEQQEWLSWEGVGDEDEPVGLPDGVTFVIENGCCRLTLNGAALTGETWFGYDGEDGEGNPIQLLPYDYVIIELKGENSITTTAASALGFSQLSALVEGDGSLTLTTTNNADSQKDDLGYYYPLSALDLGDAEKLTVKSGDITVKVDGDANSSWDEDGTIQTEAAVLTAVNGGADLNLVVSGGKLKLEGERGINFGDNGGILNVSGGELTMPGGYLNAVYQQTGGTVNVTGVCTYEAPADSESMDYWEGLSCEKAFTLDGGTLNVTVPNGEGTWSSGLNFNHTRVNIKKGFLNVTVGAGVVLNLCDSTYYEQTGGTVTLKNTNPEDPMGLSIGSEDDAWPNGSAVKVSGGKLTVYGDIDVHGSLEIAGGEVEAGPCPGVEYPEGLWRGTIYAPNTDDFLLSSIKVSGSGKLTATTIAGDAWAMYVGGHYTQSGGEVTLNGMNGGTALEASGFVTVEKGTLTAASDEGVGCQLYRDGDKFGRLTVNGGAVNFTGSYRGLVIYGGASVVLNDGQLNATGNTAVSMANWCYETVTDEDDNTYEDVVHVTNPENEEQGDWLADLENRSSLIIHGGSHTFKGVVQYNEEYGWFSAAALWGWYAKVEIDGGTLHLITGENVEGTDNLVLNMDGAAAEGYFTLGSNMRTVCNVHGDAPVLHNKYMEDHKWMEADYYPTYWLYFAEDEDPEAYNFCTDVTIEPIPEDNTFTFVPKTGEKAETPAMNFTDVKKSDWYYESVKFVWENGLMNGTGNGQFSPNANTTRGMVVTILARLEGVDTSKGASWYEAGQQWAMKNGISDGTNMDGKITREQLAAMLYRYAQLKGYAATASADLSTFKDASSVSDWAREAMEWAVGVGLIQGSDNQLAPTAPATRAQIAAILMRFMENVVK